FVIEENGNSYNVDAKNLNIVSGKKAERNEEETFRDDEKEIQETIKRQEKDRQKESRQIQKFPATASSIASKVIMSAENKIGSTYVYGDTGKEGYDCSGLVYSIYNDELGISIPSFWLAFLLIYLFAVKLGWFKTLSYNAMSGSFFQKLYKFFLPSLAIAIPNIATIIRYMQSAILDEINKDYVRTARMKGLLLKDILYKHVLRNALVPVITIIGISITSSVGGSLIVENVFSLPGIGSLIVQSISSRDFPLIQSVVFAVAFMVIFINLIIDILYRIVDPRIRG
ncbi:MAG: ABC transporter permease subunit, partial [Cutibacterium avidum]|nr:ABC transporter permease subunit [Cutibacterium avidum]